MPLPEPEPGLVICYQFLWSHEAGRGEEWGQKNRPCAIILAVKNELNEIRVTVAPITHRKPNTPKEGVQIPPRVGMHLGLDSSPSWVIFDELNEFTWPGLDIHPIRSGVYHYGFLPPLLFTQIRDAILALDASERALIERTD